MELNMIIHMMIAKTQILCRLTTGYWKESLDCIILRNDVWYIFYSH